MEWWHCGPVLLAVVMFLLFGTIIQKQIETVFRRLIECYRRPVSQTTSQTASQTASQPPPANTEPQPTAEAPTTPTPAASPSTEKKPISIETKSATSFGRPIPEITERSVSLHKPNEIDSMLLEQ